MAVSSGLPWFAFSCCWKNGLNECVSRECLLWGCSARTGNENSQICSSSELTWKGTSVWTAVSRILGQDSLRWQEEGGKTLCSPIIYMHCLYLTALHQMRYCMSLSVFLPIRKLLFSPGNFYDLSFCFFCWSALAGHSLLEWDCTEIDVMLYPK